MDPSDRALVLSDSMPLKLLLEPFGQMARVGKEALLPLVDSCFIFEEEGAFNDGLTGDVAEIVALRSKVIFIEDAMVFFAFHLFNLLYLLMSLSSPSTSAA
jgi:hypothetical protein